MFYTIVYKHKTEDRSDYIIYDGDKASVILHGQEQAAPGMSMVQVYDQLTLIWDAHTGWFTSDKDGLR